MYIVKPELDDDGVNQAVERVNQLIQQRGGSVQKVTPWGKRRLAYPVGTHQEGYYVLTEFDLDGSKVHEIERALKISDTVFRHLLTVQEKG
jgi:small subunit ribosomal protein S6